MILAPEIRSVLEHPAPWLPRRSLAGTIAISTRIRLARNIGALPFPLNASPAIREKAAEMFFHAMETARVSADFIKLDMNAISEPESLILLERKLISSEFRKKEPGRYLAYSPARRIAVMVNEEDHLRIQYCAPGLCPAKAWKETSAFDTLLRKKILCAFLPGLGFATSCPSNLGTGLRVSVMLHLPALVITGRIKTFASAMEAMRLTIRGFSGEGSENAGNFYQVSNQTTLGETEGELVTRLGKNVETLVEEEKTARGELLRERPAFLMNLCARAYALLKYSYLLSSVEALNLLSGLRLGADLGFFPKVRFSDIDRLTLLVQSAHLSVRNGAFLSPEERAAARADMVRKTLGNSAPSAPDSVNG